jgi:hypothetical protein
MIASPTRHVKMIGEATAVASNKLVREIPGALSKSALDVSLVAIANGARWIFISPAAGQKWGAQRWVWDSPQIDSRKEPQNWDEAKFVGDGYLNNSLLNFRKTDSMLRTYKCILKDQLFPGAGFLLEDVKFASRNKEAFGLLGMRDSPKTLAVVAAKLA